MQAVVDGIYKYVMTGSMVDFPDPLHYAPSAPTAPNLWEILLKKKLPQDIVNNLHNSNGVSVDLQQKIARYAAAKRLFFDALEQLNGRSLKTILACATIASGAVLGLSNQFRNDKNRA